MRVIQLSCQQNQIPFHGYLLHFIIVMLNIWPQRGGTKGMPVFVGLYVDLFCVSERRSLPLICVSVIWWSSHTEFTTLGFFDSILQFKCFILHMLVHADTCGATRVCRLHTLNHRLKSPKCTKSCISKYVCCALFHLASGPTWLLSMGRSSECKGAFSTAVVKVLRLPLCRSDTLSSYFLQPLGTLMF